MIVCEFDRVIGVATLLVMADRNEAGTGCGELEADLGAFGQ